MGAMTNPLLCHLYCSLAHRPAGSHFSADTVALAFLPVMGAMLSAAFALGGRTEEVRWMVAALLLVCCSADLLHTVCSKLGS